MIDRTDLREGDYFVRNFDGYQYFILEMRDDDVIIVQTYPPRRWEVFSIDRNSPWLLVSKWREAGYRSYRAKKER